MVSAIYFNVFGVSPFRGRLFTADEDMGQGAHAVVVLSHGAWKNLFASDPNVVGRTIPVNGRAMTIVGIAPPDFRGTLPIIQPMIWVPLTQVGLSAVVMVVVAILLIIALGARRSALIRQLLVESLFFSLGITTLTGILFGIVPALQATHPSLIPALKGEAPAGESRSRTTKGVVVAQIALSMVLLVCAALFLVNLRSATSIDKGFSAKRILLTDLNPGLQGTRARAHGTSFDRHWNDCVRVRWSKRSA